MRRRTWLLSSLALLPVAGHAAGGGWGNGGGSSAVDSAARAAATSALTLAQGSIQQSKNLSDLANANAALSNLGGIPTGLLGAPSGIAVLNGSRMLSASQIPFGTAAGTVADGGALTAATAMAGSALQPGGNGSGLMFAPGGSGTATTGAALAALANSAIPGSMLGAASGVASLDGSRHVLGAQIPFGTGTGTVADGARLAATSTLAGAAIPNSMLGAASGVATLDGSKHVVGAQIPFGTASGTVADGGTLAATNTLAGAAIPSSMLGAALGVATLDGNKHVASAQIPFGSGTGTVADGGALAATNMLAGAAVPSSMLGAASGVATLDGNRHVVGAQIPFGTNSGTVADGGMLAATNTLAGAAVPGSMLGAAAGVATLDGNRHVVGAQIPFGTNPGTVADGGMLAATSTLASAAVPGSMLGAAAGVASLDGSKHVVSAQIPFGTASGTVADGGTLAATSTLAGAAIPNSMLGAAAGVATLDGNRHVIGAQIPFGTSTGSVADGGTLAATSTLANAAVPNSMLGAASGVATLDGSKHVVGVQIPFGSATGTVADGGTLAATNTLAGAAVPSSMLGAASGVATLDGSKHVVGTQIPFGTATGTVADGGAFTAALQNVAVTFLKIGSAEGGVVHVLGLNGVAETVGRTLAQRASDVWNIADHGADGTAANDDIAMANGLAYAKAHPRTTVFTPSGTWPLAVSSTYPGFAIPSNTKLSGAANNGTVFTWNDTNGGYSLFTDPAPTNNARNSNIVLQDIVVQGQWGPCAGCSYVGGGNNAIFLLAVDDVTLDHVVSRYSGAFGMTVRASTNVKLLNDSVYFSSSDGINLDDDSGIYAQNFNVQHTADDCFSAHSDIYDQGGVRRNIQIIGGLCFDTHAIDIASPVSLSITGTIIDSFKVSAISLSGTMANPNTSEGNSQAQDVTIDNVTMTNGIGTSGPAGDPANFDPNDPTDAQLNYVIVGARSARAGNLTYVPGENGTSPYPYTLDNSQSATMPVPAWRTFRIINSTFGRHFGATNTTALPNWNALGQGGIVTKDGVYTPSLTEGDLIGPGITIYSPNVMRNLAITGNTFEGLGTALYMPPNSSGHMADFQFDYNRMIDMRYNCLDVEFSGIVGDISDNLCDADPYFASGNRGSIGNWGNNGALTGFIITVPGLTVQRNAFENVSNDTNVNTSNPTTGDLFRDNIDYANPQTIDGYNIYNGGIGYVHSAGFSLIQIGTNPSDPSWDKVLSVPVEAAPAMPTTGFWMPGEFVRNSAPSSGNTALGWLRVTLSNNGSSYPYAAPTNNVAGTDWIVK